ncbi:MAG: TIGR02221 family CRISPR-associated protein, partial [Chitinispirillaceae bacterium]
MNRKSSKPVRYVQEALAEHICKDWASEDKFLVFATKDELDAEGKKRGGGGSISLNWDNANINDYDKEGKAVEPKPVGLKERLAGLGLHCKVEKVEIPDGTADGEIWGIIRKITEHISKKDEVHFDVTHSFRYIPMIVPAIISFLKRTKEIKLGDIHYGAFEALGSPQEISKMPIGKRTAQVRNLREIYEMIEWSEAVQAFKDNGDERLLVKKMDSANNFQSTKSSIRKLAGKLSRAKKDIIVLGDSIRMTNVTELEKIKGNEDLSQISMGDAPELFPLTELGKEIGGVMSLWTDDEVANGFNAAEWSSKNHKLAQALTFTHEAAIGFFCKIVGWDMKNKYHRSSIDYLLAIKRKDHDPDTNQTATPDGFRGEESVKKWFMEDAERALLKLDGFESLAFAFKTLRDWRNTVNHAKKGDREYIK